MPDGKTTANSNIRLLTSPVAARTRPQRYDWCRNTSSSTAFGLQHYTFTSCIKNLLLSP